MSTTEIFFIALFIIFTFPYLVWRLGSLDYYAPLVVVQIIGGILLGPGILGHAFPDIYSFIFNKQVIQSLNGLAWWGVSCFVMLAGIEMDLRQAWINRRESTITAGFALGTPLLFGCIAALGFLQFPGWLGAEGRPWQFILGVGMACAVTALPILVLLMEKLEILRQPIGQRILRYASLDDIAIWGVLSVVLMDWDRLGKQGAFLAGYAVCAYLIRKLIAWLPPQDRWYILFIWLPLCAFFADWSGLHFMVGSFLAGVVIDHHWFEQKQMDLMRNHVLMVVMPVFFLSTGLRTNWQLGGTVVLLGAAVLLFVSVAGKLIGLRMAGWALKWEKGEASLIGWLLQTKALIEIIFANVLLDKHIITDETFTALLLMAVSSTMLTIPVVNPMLKRLKSVIFKTVKSEPVHASEPLPDFTNKHKKMG
ncbi:cation:proton antiporter [Candidatus Methylobacter oryzae]|uniref:Cation:proton antiporter n=1 Tax=Candidatus Methylobacter oryzae TaxID=2497749 RepID=A0ABY3C659_9GAMM|nr:cation:proton antiporter [Candidatus Methylobacter oryzae]TRW90757.1 cation:proton antiporter [Candidatus Methylobacter oryzae]